eukprot:COSAG02_NODE_5585_length_4212_cov_3.607829_4_plen_185_part_00
MTAHRPCSGAASGVDALLELLWSLRGRRSRGRGPCCAVAALPASPSPSPPLPLPPCDHRSSGRTHCLPQAYPPRTTPAGGATKTRRCRARIRRSSRSTAESTPTPWSRGRRILARLQVCVSSARTRTPRVLRPAPRVSLRLPVRRFTFSLTTPSRHARRRARATLPGGPAAGPPDDAVQHGRRT